MSLTQLGGGAAQNNSGLVSVEFTFRGESAHSAGRPWLGRSALDAVELMNVGWNFRREHLRAQQRSHYVVTSGGDQPNVVPPVASVWYFTSRADRAEAGTSRPCSSSLCRLPCEKGRGC